MTVFGRKKSYSGPVVMGTEEIMKKKAHGTTEDPVQENLKWNVDRKKADKICCFNRHYAEHSGYFLRTDWLKEMKARDEAGAPTDYFDSVTGKLLFSGPKNRTFNEFLTESKKHGWPSFRDDEVNWDVVRVLPGGETVSIDGTHLGHNLPDSKGNRYCINLVCIAGYATTEAEFKREDTKGLQIYSLEKNSAGCTGMFWRPDPRPGQKSSGSGSNWPRDGAQLKGIVYEVQGEKWLECFEVMQKGKGWEKCQKGSWMPFKYSQYYLKPVV
uniref:Uncharacterized protein n=1 Tax=Aplanochytrium stocchinoi TaxID=215587 RepID=A0A7S3PNV4_9STRA|mmetsp:Transcript_29456/g.36388  ORF Transcript_29456/g.36388 Transcript_29456/m.36388 type:complete len:270 (+) Transcript_29456:124-933(+)|eukprot:CAMPEP_0204830896 /NCGR_PEP_ID=MMETSP1346-20131115/9477_1 /ASSEMBLY_ACC=CAM_ASM_000771 /TAXON_ID=215587 /ORGANISM="Aplanochytrium stocchinoi, Strain GSBS06" /LENGTH=269 /DNA_ID=CAMNT_0051961507 /DNA_START=94 /DNA_END=903 /DNA_ORIENTATION=-